MRTLLALTILTCSANTYAQKSTPEPTIRNNNKLITNNLIPSHEFKDTNGNSLGVLYTFSSAPANESDLFQRLLITQNQDGKNVVLYEIYKTKLINKDNEVEAEISEEGFSGYKLRLAEDLQITLSCCGASVSDDITIEWNPNKKYFQLLTTP